MRQLRARRGPFVERPYYTLEEIDRICSEELQGVGLYPAQPGPVRIERFIEKRFKITPIYEELDSRVLGYTRFGPTGVEGIVVSRALAENTTTASARRVSATLAHEAGHALLHGHLFVLEGSASLFDNPAEPSKILCRDGEVAGAGERRLYDGRWWEYQANRAIGGILLPKALALRCVSDLVEPTGGLGAGVLESAEREWAVRRLAETFEVNSAVARIRLDDLFPPADGAQLTL